MSSIMLDWWKDLNRRLDAQNLSPQDKNRRIYIELSKLHLNPPKWRQWGKEMLEVDLDPFPYIYTPGIGTAILAHKEGFDIDSKIPESIRPLDLLASQGETLQGLQGKILAKASHIYHLHHPSKNLDTASPRPLTGWGAVITNKRRVLGFGEVPEGGEWITRGKVDCYEMATEGKVSLMLPIAVNVEAIKHDNKIHDKYIKKLLILLEKLGIAFIQFEDFDGESAFRILDWSRKNLKTPVFNDDIEGTAWIILLAKLASSRQFPHLSFYDSLFIFHGGGGASVGTANFLEEYLTHLYTKSGMTKQQSHDRIHRQFLMTDSAGLLYKIRNVKSKAINTPRGWQVTTETVKTKDTTGVARRDSPGMEGPEKPEFKPFQLKWILNDPNLLKKLGKDGGKITLKDTIEILGPKILGPQGSIFLIGLSTRPNQFTEDVIRTARKILDLDPERKSIPLFIDSCSNPTHKTEILTEEESQQFPQASNDEKQKIIKKAIERAYAAADYRLRLTTGSPMHHPEFMVSQLNNFLGFPAAGLVLLSRSLPATNYQLPTNINKLGESIAKTCLHFLVTREKDRFQKGALCPTSRDLLTLTKKAAEKAL